MTPQEQDLIDQLTQRLKQQAGSQPKDPEAEALIRRAVQENPDAPYLLVQTVLIQDMALNSAQGRIKDLERQLEEAKAQPKQATSFLGNLLGGGAAQQPRPAPSAGPWGQPQPPQQQPQQPGPWGSGQQQGAYPPGGYAPGGYPPGGYPPGGYAPQVQPSATSGFLRSAAATAAGVAGGALLFQGIQSMFGHHALGGMGGWNSASLTQPSLTETTEIVNNNYYYGSDPNAGSTSTWGPDTAATPDANWSDNAGNDDYRQVAGNSYDDGGQDIASNDDFGGGDGGDDYA